MAAQQGSSPQARLLLLFVWSYPYEKIKKKSFKINLGNLANPSLPNGGKEYISEYN